jgi:glycosyltransferase involved in cell wall biosynthesis
MRILHVIPFLWSGAGNVLTRLCQSQTKHNKVAVVTSGRSKDFSDWPEYTQTLRRAGVELFKIDFFDRAPEVFWPSVDAFDKLARTWKPDLIHCHSGVPAAGVALSGRRFIAQIHSWGIDRPAWMNAMDLSAFRQADRVVCSSMGYRRILTDGGINPMLIHQIPWGLDILDLTARSRGASATANSFRIGFLGRVEPRKNQLCLAKAFQKFHNRYPHSKLEFVGPFADNQYAGEVRRFIAKAGLGDRVKLVGRVANPYPRVRSWNLFTSLSCDEGQGIAVLEAMALGVPVLGRCVAGIEDYLHDRQTGITVDSASAQEVAAGMEWALHHKEELAIMASQARRMVENQYSWQSTVRRIRNVYETITGADQRLA